jgi:hypothetical protein
VTVSNSAVLAAGLMLAATGLAHAQITTNTIVNSAIDQQRFNHFMANTRFNMMMAGAQAAGTRRALLAGKRLPRNSSPSATLFVVSSDPIAPEKLASQYGSTAKERKELAEVAHVFLRTHRATLERDGAREHDLAHVLAYFLRMNYFVYGGGKAELTREQAAGLVEIMRAFIVDHPQFKTMAERDKQERYETLAIVGTYVAAGYEAARKRNDPALMTRLRAMAQSHIEEVLGPIDAIVLTRDGFIYR